MQCVINISLTPTSIGLVIVYYDIPAMVWGFVGFGDALTVHIGSDAVWNIVVCSELADDVGATDDSSGLAECETNWDVLE